MSQNPGTQLATGYPNQSRPPANVSNPIPGQNGVGYPMSQSMPMNGGGMQGYYTAAPYPVNAQQFSNVAAYDPVAQNPTLNLPKHSYIVQNTGVAGSHAHYEVYNAQLPQSGGGFQAQQMYYQQAYPGMPQGAYIAAQQAPVPMYNTGNQYAAHNYSNAPQNYQNPVQSQPTQQTQPANSAQPTAQPPRQRKVLNFTDPETGKAVLGELEAKTKAAEAPPAEQQPTQQPPAAVPQEQEEKPVVDDEAKKGEDIKQRFISMVVGTIADEQKKPVEKAEVPPPQTVNNAVQQPVPASSAPPPSINVVEEEAPKQTSAKAASVEPIVQNEVPAQNNNDTNLTVERQPSPTLTTTSETKEMQQQPDEDETEKLLELERRFNNLYETEKENIEEKVYSFEVMDMIREIVKCYKKVPVPGDPEWLKKKGLDIQSELPQQMQSRPKYSNTSNAFNPGWNNNQQQIVGGNKRNYMGRHSDNKQRSNIKKSFPGRPSIDRTRQPPPPPVMDLRKAENAWKPKRRGDAAEQNEDDKKLETLRKDVRSILNKITPTSYDALIEDFKKMDVGQSEKSQQIAIELIFDKAVEEPKFCSLYTNLCKDQVDRGKRTVGSFFHTLIQKVQATFEGNSAFDVNIKELETQLEGETDERKKTDLEDRLEMLKNKEKRYILGNIKFISHLYTVDLIADNIIAFCVSKLHQMFVGTNDDIYVQYGIELLELISTQYFSQLKKSEREEKKNSKAGGSDNVQSFVHWVSSKECKDSVSTKIKVMIMNFEDFVKAGYKKRNAEKGPKKINELHDEIRKEEENKQNERIAYEARKKEERFTSHQKQNYGGRGSFDRKNLQEKKSNAVTASISAGNTAPPKKTISLLRNVDEKAKLGKKSYFNAKGPSEGGEGNKAEESGDSWTVVQ